MNLRCATLRVSTSSTSGTTTHHPPSALDTFPPRSRLSSVYLISLLHHNYSTITVISVAARNRKNHTICPDGGNNFSTSVAPRCICAQSDRQAYLPILLDLTKGHSIRIRFPTNQQSSSIIYQAATSSILPTLYSTLELGRSRSTYPALTTVCTTVCARTHAWMAVTHHSHANHVLLPECISCICIGLRLSSNRTCSLVVGR